MPNLYKSMLLWIGCVLAYSSLAQPPSWEEIDFLPENEFSMSNSGNIMYTSNNLGKMYLNGPVKYFEGSIFQYAHHLIEYDGSTWTPLLDYQDQDFGNIHHIEDYLDGIIFIREFEDEVYNRWIETIYYDGDTFESLGLLDIKNDAFGAYVNNNTIYIASFFGDEDEEVFDILKYVDGTWSQAFSTNPLIETGVIRSLIEFDGDWYVGGVHFNGGESQTENIYRLHDGTWSILQDIEGNGMLGTVRKMVNYGGKLAISVERGNGPYDPSIGQGTGIILWDGVNWSGLQTLSSINQSIAWVAVWDLKVSNGNLFAIGNFRYAQELPMNYLAKWNGSQWCGLQTEEWEGELVALRIGLFEDQIIHFANPWGDLNRFFRHDGITYEPCTTPVDISEQSLEEFLIYPNPVNNGYLHVATETPLSRMEVINSWGQVVLQPDPLDQQIDVSRLPPGIYHLRMWQEDNHPGGEATFVVQ